jgi:hypothetical protein
MLACAAAPRSHAHSDPHSSAASCQQPTRRVRSRTLDRPPLLRIHDSWSARAGCHAPTSKVERRRLHYRPDARQPLQRARRDAEHRHRPPKWVARGRAASVAWSSCRRRSNRGSRTPTGGPRPAGGGGPERSACPASPVGRERRSCSEKAPAAASPPHTRARGADCSSSSATSSSGPTVACARCKRGDHDRAQHRSPPRAPDARLAAPHSARRGRSQKAGASGERDVQSELRNGVRATWPAVHSGHPLWHAHAVRRRHLPGEHERGLGATMPRDRTVRAPRSRRAGSRRRSRAARRYGRVVHRIFATVPQITSVLTPQSRSRWSSGVL